MMYWHDTWTWFWMLPMMLIWVIVVGAVIYIAVRLANDHSRSSQRPQ